MGVRRSAHTRLAPAAERQVIWHDLECGGYEADLALWRELAAESHDGSPADPILEVGAGTGYVALRMAKRVGPGGKVYANDLQPEMLDKLRQNAAKAGVVAFTEALAAEVAGEGVTVLCVSPGSVDTSLLARVAPGVKADMKPAEIARIVRFLASDDAGPSSGANLVVRGKH